MNYQKINLKQPLVPLERVIDVELEEIIPEYASPELCLTVSRKTVRIESFVTGIYKQFFYGNHSTWMWIFEFEGGIRKSYSTSNFSPEFNRWASIIQNHIDEYEDKTMRWPGYFSRVRGYISWRPDMTREFIGKHLIDKKRIRNEMLVHGIMGS